MNYHKNYRLKRWDCFDDLVRSLNRDLHAGYEALSKHSKTVESNVGFVIMKRDKSRCSANSVKRFDLESHQ